MKAQMNRFVFLAAALLVLNVGCTKGCSKNEENTEAPAVQAPPPAEVTPVPEAGAPATGDAGAAAQPGAPAAGTEAAPAAGTEAAPATK